MLIFSFKMRVLTQFVNFSSFVTRLWLTYWPYLPVNDGCRRLCMDLWAFSLTKEPFHDYEQSVNHQLSFRGTGHSRGGTGTTTTNGLDRFSTVKSTCWNKVPCWGTEERNPPLKLKTLPWVCLSEDHTFF